MLVTRERHSCVNAYLNIFYKREIYLEFVDITGPTTPKTQKLLESDYAHEYLNFLKRQILDDEAEHVGERYTFVNLTVSLLEVLIKKRIEYHIQSNWINYKSTWRTLSLEPAYDANLLGKELLSEPSRNTPKHISHVISHSFSYQSLPALNYFLNNLSLIENFFDYHLEKTSAKKPTFNKKLITKLIYLRNNSTHELADYKLSKDYEIKEIQFDLENVIMDMLNIITKSFDTRNILFKKKITDELDKEKLSKQKERMNKIYLAFDRRHCKHCSHKSKCKYCIKIPAKYYSDENKLIKKDLENQLNRLEKLMRGL
jgi:hypothetical protein